MATVAEELTSPPQSAPTGSSETERPLQCPHCDFVGKTERGLSVHIAFKHKGEREPSWEDKPRRVAPSAETAEPTIPAPPPIDLSAVGKDLASNIQTVGQLLHGVLYALKVRHVMTGEPPAVDTHLAYAVQLRAQMTADVLMGYAANNPALLKLVQGFNNAFKGGELGMVIGSHVIAAAATVNIETPISKGIESMFIPDVQALVDKENQELEAARLRMAHAQANGAA